MDLRHEFTPPILEMIVIRYENKPLGILHLLKADVSVGIFILELKMNWLIATVAMGQTFSD